MSPRPHPRKLLQAWASGIQRYRSDWPPLLLALAAADLRRFTKLLRDQADPNDTGPGTRSPLVIAALCRRPIWVKSLLAAGASDPNSALWEAAKWTPDPDIHRALIKGGADPNYRDTPGGPTVLHAAAYQNPEAVPVLLELGADPDARDEFGRTPLHYVVDQWFQDDLIVQTLRILLEADVDPNARDQDGQTPLHLAMARSSRSACLPVLSLLIQAGADPEIPDRSDLTARELAAEQSIELSDLGQGDDLPEGI